MKNNMKTLFLVTLIGLVTMVNASAANQSLSMKIIGNRSFQISVNNVVGQAQLKIMDGKGVTLYQSGVDHSGYYSRKFDVSNLPVGSYSLVIADEYKTKIVALSIQKKVSLNLDKVTTHLNPIITVVANEVTVSMHSLARAQMTISFYDESSNEIENHRLKGEGYIAKKFSLKSLDAGSYKVLVNHKGRIFSKEITI